MVRFMFSAGEMTISRPPKVRAPNLWNRDGLPEFSEMKCSLRATKKPRRKTEKTKR